MKKLLLAILSLSGLHLLNAETLQDAMKRTSDFISWKKQKKNDWFTHIQAYENAKFDLMRRHHDENFDLLQASTAQIAQDGYSPELAAKNLNAMISLAKKHMVEWKDLASNFNKQAEELGKNQWKQLENLEKENKAATHQKNGKSMLETIKAKL